MLCRKCAAVISKGELQTHVCGKPPKKAEAKVKRATVKKKVEDVKD